MHTPRGGLPESYVIHASHAVPFPHPQNRVVIAPHMLGKQKWGEGSSGKSPGGREGCSQAPVLPDTDLGPSCWLSSRVT